MKDLKEMEKRAQGVINSYSVHDDFKDLERTGWNVWHVKRHRIESVPEHVYGAVQLAVAMWSEFDDYKDINIDRVIALLQFHENEETLMGDITQFQMPKEVKEELGQEADDMTTGLLRKGSYVRELVREFDERKTPEAIFAYMCDKLECDLHSKWYDEEGCVDLNDQEGNEVMRNARVQALLNTGKSWSGMWMQFGRDVYAYDDNFRFVSEYAEKVNLHEPVRKLKKEFKEKAERIIAARLGKENN